MQRWYEISVHTVIAFTIIVELYLLWLIVCKTPAKMASFRFSLLMLVLNELCFTVTVGILIDADMMVPQMRATVVNGFGRLLGQDGGRIMFALALFFGAGIFCLQVYCLWFRYTAIQQRFVNLHKHFNSWPVRFGMLLFGCSLMCLCAFLAYNFVDSPEEIQQYVREHLISHPELNELVKINDSVLIILNKDFMRGLYFGIFVMGGFMLASAISIGFSVYIYRTISANAAHFTEHTFKLHRQLTMLLIIQFCLPMFFLVIPVIFAVVSVIFDLPISKLSGDISVLFLCFYSVANSLVCIWFVTPYRRFTVELILRLKLIFPINPSTVRPVLPSMATTVVELAASARSYRNDTAEEASHRRMNSNH